MKGILSVRASKDSAWYCVPMLKMSIQPVLRLTDVILNNGDASTNSANVSVDFTYADGTPTHYKINNVNDMSTVSWIPFTTKPISFTLSSFGTNNVYIQLKDDKTETAILSDSIIYVDSS